MLTRGAPPPPGWDWDTALHKEPGQMYCAGGMALMVRQEDFLVQDSVFCSGGLKISGGAPGNLSIFFSNKCIKVKEIAPGGIPWIQSDQKLDNY